MAAPNARHALVLGASGISGWSLINQLLQSYPRAGTWSRITGVTRKPMNSEEVSSWPQSREDQAFRLVSGFDIHNDPKQTLMAKFQEEVPDIHTVTHLYYLIQDPPSNYNDDEPFVPSLKSLQKTVTVIESLASNLEFIHLQYGTFIYGVCFTEEFYHTAPLSESLPPLRKSLLDRLHYPVWTKWMHEYSIDKPWKWCETRPDEVIGFVPRMNSYNAVYPIAMFLSLYRFINGKGAACPFPGSLGTWKALASDAGADMIAKASIHLSLHPSPWIKGEGFNVASSETPWRWEMKWPPLCEWFGLIGEPPVDNEKSKTSSPGPDKYIQSHEAEYKSMIQEYGLKAWDVASPSMDGSENWGLTKLNFDRYLDLQKLRSTGFMEDESPRDTWINVLELMRAARIIP
ncbi:hypothetical protein H112_02217 [Trichophyton rubrum D6]|uniref:PRISE-like Rossmann-fold domain-containing protein n=4 Tax=Trichophyton TaxID=5550 RepID=A0A178EYX8_TRIRU|nr:uncharacterized protein TERG_06978 [Trichophyton rubrum CBS 118892]EZF25488.1 hypothetical protein H100_02217 [Trichophyton rubrum MR850]EZF44498.1 hypothetical protein H102_02213 [Trichophyton rubrum CBS 100081]EZF55166.1 hypothetical protein H103_02222 [Trichophyton rubrum CBS 288.86]EZF65784.1 hypothetical protein H104_02198 [Trichophyton rubrum CBS 289.86]EZF76413.1 hypothetical protein H105_02234 [Trichophyton soudanense CBS 452.61]EZF87061.1 hypothetical protein H110_02219 [Trichophy